MNEPSNVILLVPAGLWTTLELQLPSATQRKVVDVTADVTKLLDVAEEIPRCATINAVSGLEITCSMIGLERKHRLVQAIRRFRSPFDLLGGRRVYRRKIV